MELTYSKKNINKEIIFLMLPTILENVLQLLAGVVTTAMVGRLMADDISAQGISNRLYQIFFALFRGLGMGATVIVALYYGKKELARCRRVIEQAYLTAIPIIGIALFVILVFPERILSIFSSDKELVKTAVSYSRIAAWAIPSMAVICFNTAAFNGQGNTKVPMFIAVILNIVNVIVGYVFIFGIGSVGGWGITGAAMATVISQFVGAVIGLFILYRKIGYFNLSPHNEKFFSFDKFEVKNFFATGMPAAMEHMFWQFSAIIMSKVLLGYGSNVYAAYQLGLQAEMLTEMPAQGFVVASTTLSARAIGQKDSPLYKSYFTQLIKMAFVIAIFAAASLFIFPLQFMQLLTNKPDLQQIGAGYVFLMGFAQIPQVTSKVYNGLIRSSGGKRVPMYMSFIGIWIVRVPLVILFGWILKMDVRLIWITIAADNIMRMVLSIIYMKRKDTYNYVDNMIKAEA